MKVQLEANNLQAKGEAEGIAGKLNGKSFIVTRQASETGQLYGSVSARDIAMLLSDGGFTVARNQIALNNPIKMVGLHKLAVALHPEVEVSITINVARNADEAERQARGEDVTQRREGRGRRSGGSRRSRCGRVREAGASARRRSGQRGRREDRRLSKIGGRPGREVRHRYVEGTTAAGGGPGSDARTPAGVLSAAVVDASRRLNRAFNGGRRLDRPSRRLTG